MARPLMRACKIEPGARGSKSAPLSLFVAVHHGRGAWIEVSTAGMLLYVPAMVLSHGRFAAARPAR